MDGWSYAWLAWGLVFLVIEGLALARTAHGAGTLSANIWRWMGVKDHRYTWWVIARRLLLALALVVLTTHLALGVP